jgi:mRNA interferase RelE/StbE
MPEYAVVFARSARRELDKLPEQVVDRIFPRIESLRENPRPHGCRKIKGSENLWRIRVGDYRVIYSIEDRRRLVDIIAVRHRSDAYD